MLRILIISSFVLLIILPCQGCGRRGAVKTAEAVAVGSGPGKFTMPTVPSSLVSDQDRFDYMLSHYWDNADFKDAGWAAAREKSEEIFGTFIFYAVNSPKQDVANDALKKMLESARVDSSSYALMMDFVDKYLYDPNSPVRNEELYITALESIIENPSMDDVYKIAPRARLEMAMKNRLGSKATDFSFTTSKGKRGSMYGVDADYLLIFFYNLGCPACREIRLRLLDVLKDPVMANKFESGKFKILALYPDTQMEEWDEYVNDIPNDWINAYDAAQDINNNELYDLKAIPSLYLLDKNKTVLLKDFIDPGMLYDHITAEK